MTSTDRRGPRPHRRGHPRRREARTSGEIYCVVARASDGYFVAAALFVTLGILRREPGLGACPRPHGWATVAALAFRRRPDPGRRRGARRPELLSGACACYFVPLRHRYRKAHDNALKPVPRPQRAHHRGTHRRSDLRLARRALCRGRRRQRHQRPHATGDLERTGRESGRPRRAEQARRRLRRRDRHGRRSILAQHFPVATHDRNELDDHLIEIVIVGRAPIRLRLFGASPLWTTDLCLQWLAGRV